ncbi:putative hyaluronan/mRNA-binding protein [Helianthus anomalus]
MYRNKFKLEGPGRLNWGSQADEITRLKKRRWKLTKSLHPSMQQLSNKKSSDEIFAKLGTSKDKRKEIAEKEEKA